MKYSVFIPHRFPGLNDYIGAERKHRMIAAKMKKEWTELSASYFRKLPIIDEPIFIQFLFHESNAKRDPDNFVAFARKAILDGLVTSGKLPNDTQKWVAGWEDSWDIDKEKPGVELHISW